MKNRLLISSFLLVAIFFGGCKKEEQSPVVIIVPAEERVKDADSGKPVEFRFQIVANEADLEKLFITARGKNMIPSTVLDTLLSKRRASIDLLYFTPYVEAEITSRIELELKASDRNGNECITSFYVVITRVDTPMQTKLHNLYGNTSGKDNGLWIKGQATVKEGSGNENVDLYVAQISDHAIKSHTNKFFAVAKNVDFEKLSVERARIETKKLSFGSMASDLATGDVIFVRDANQNLLMVAKIDIGKDDNQVDRYRLSTKYLPIGN